MTESSDVLSLIKWQNKIRSNPDAKQQMRAEAGRPLWEYTNALAKWTPPTEFINKLRAVVSTFPCEDCSKHGLMYIDSHPFNPSTDNPKKYVCEFHNIVSAHIHRDQHEDKPVYNCDIFCDTGELIESEVALDKALSQLPPPEIKVATEVPSSIGLVQPESRNTHEMANFVATPTERTIYLDPLQLFPVVLIQR